jgi:hypothetical protein
MDYPEFQVELKVRLFSFIKVQNVQVSISLRL